MKIYIYDEYIILRGIKYGRDVYACLRYDISCQLT